MSEVGRARGTRAVPSHHQTQPPVGLGPLDPGLARRAGADISKDCVPGKRLLMGYGAYPRMPWISPSPALEKFTAWGRGSGVCSRGKKEAPSQTPGQKAWAGTWGCLLTWPQSVRVRSAPPTKRDWMQVTCGSWAWNRLTAAMLIPEHMATSNIWICLHACPMVSSVL